MSQTQATPIHFAASRLVGVDLARALAVAGMMAVHMLPSRAADGGATGMYAVFGGRSAALFAVLAGVGLGLVSGRTRPPVGRARWSIAVGILARALVLTLIGFYLGSLESPVAVILVHYGLLFALGTLFLGGRPKQLFTLAAVWLIAMPWISHLIRRRMDQAPISVPTFESLSDPANLLIDLGLTGYYPVLPWLAYLLAGLAAGRLQLGSVRVAAWLFAGGAGLAVTAWLASSWLLSQGGIDRLSEPLPIQFRGVTPADNWWYLAVVTPHSATPFDLAHTIGTSLAVLGLGLLITSGRKTFIGLVVAAGSMSLTIYSLHVVALALEIGPEAELPRYLIHLVALFVFAAVWRALVGKGPLETMAAEIATTVRRWVGWEDRQGLTAA